MPTGERLAAPEGAMRLTALAAGAVGAALVATYLAIIVSEGDNTVGEIAPWAALMSGGAVLSLVAAAMPATTARWLLALSALLFLPFVLVSSLSYFFLVPTALTCVAARQAHGLVVSGQPRATAPSP